MKMCPNLDCRAADPRQDRLSPAEQEQINASWAKDALRCSYCGGANSANADGRRVFRGYLNAPMTAGGWIPAAL
jgi:hypothetical protein